ncbi:MAG TPA: FecR domain-containing protein, partial [Phenylobacterium sp.]|nr:FecR domain-containing protein [Phenylobacterium sp.]
LGGQTRVEVRYSRTARKVQLIGGEALFTVASNPRRPFVVETPLGTMTAIGTAFDVDVDQKVVTLFVTKGEVAVRTERRGDPGDPPDLSVVAGERLQITRAGAGMRVLKERDAMAPSWLEGRLAYRAEPLERVLEDVNRYAPKPIALADEQLGKLSYTGTVRLDQIDAWTRGLSAVFPVAVDSQPEVVWLKKR